MVNLIVKDSAYVKGGLCLMAAVLFFGSGALANEQGFSKETHVAQVQKKGQELHRIKPASRVFGNPGGDASGGGGKAEKGIAPGIPTFSMRPGVKANLFMEHVPQGNMNNYRLKGGGNTYITASVGLNCGPGGHVEQLYYLVDNAGVNIVYEASNGLSNVQRTLPIEAYVFPELEFAGQQALGPAWTGDLPNNRPEQVFTSLEKNIQVTGRCQGASLNSKTYRIRINPVKVVDTDYPY